MIFSRMKTLLLLPLLLLLSCDKDGALRIAIEDSPNAGCLKSIFAKDTNFALVKAKKADILVSLDSNLNYKNAKNGNELKYMRQETILGIADGYCRCKAILGYEIGICDFAKKHAIDLANLSAEEWKLDSNAKGKMYIAGDNRWLQGRTVSPALVIGKDSDSLELGIMGGTIQLSNEIDTIAERLARIHERTHDLPGVEDVYLGNAIELFSLEYVPSFEYLAKIANILRKAGYSDIIYITTPVYDDIEINDVDRAKKMLNYIYHQYSYEEHKENKDLEYFSSYMVNLMSSKNDSSIWDFIYGFRNDLRKGAFDFETKSTEPVQIVAKMGKYKDGKIGDMSEVLFSFERVEEEKRVKAPADSADSLRATRLQKALKALNDWFEEERRKRKSSFKIIDYKDLKISDVEAKGVSFRKMLEDKK